MTFSQMLSSDSIITYDEPTTKKQITITKPIIEKPKRKQVKNACVNCQKACKKCDDGRPCKRCIKLGITATCRDSDRKERKKGVKRGPYKKRQATNKDKPVYPKLTEEITVNRDELLYENVLPHKSYTTTFDQDFYVPSQQGLQQLLSPTYTNESDETLHFTFGLPSSSSPNMLDHTTLLYQQEWDPIGFYPIDMNNNQQDYYKPQQMNFMPTSTTPFFDFTLPSQQITTDFWNYNNTYY